MYSTSMCIVQVNKVSLKPTTNYTLTENDQKAKQQSLRKSKEVMGVGQSLMLSGA